MGYVRVGFASPYGRRRADFEDSAGKEAAKKLIANVWYHVKLSSLLKKIKAKFVLNAS
jgi:hypothetical protein